MKNTLILIAGSIAFGAAAASQVRAEASPNVFTHERPVSEELLDATRGGTSLFASLSIGRLRSMTEANARSDLRFLGASGQYQMDIWWGTVGSELIAQSVRGAPPQP
ncbi:MAG: hypothetical protein EOO77_17545 [Oxalobacteraceae bacterium]|nr:MAG: hypothetical protein EOO77_17545 [Oxalobacteraceae bacterium]